MINVLPILYLVVFSTIFTAGKAAEVGFLVLFAVIGLGVGLRAKLYAEVMVPQMIILSCAGVTYFSSLYEVNTYYLVSELKVLMLFEIYMLFRWMADRHPVYFNGEIFTRFLVVHVYALALLAGFQLLRGLERETVLFGFSINAAYSVVFAYAYLHNRLGIVNSLVAIVAVGLCGSTMATLLMLAAAIYKFRKHWKVALLMSAAAVPAFLYYSLVFRGKDFVGGDIYDYDRVQLFLYFSKIAGETFGLQHYLFGWGIGREIPPADPGDFGVISGWFLLQFVVDGIFSYSTHNEYIRLIFDFGIIGMAAVLFFLRVHLPLRVFVFVCIAFLTNTTIFSTSNILILSAILGLFSSYKARRAAWNLSKYRHVQQRRPTPRLRSGQVAARNNVVGQ